MSVEPVLVAILIILVAIPWIFFPDKVFAIRNTPGMKNSEGITEAGALFYRVFGILILLMGFVGIAFEYYI